MIHVISLNFTGCLLPELTAADKADQGQNPIFPLGRRLRGSGRLSISRTRPEHEFARQEGPAHMRSTPLSVNRAPQKFSKGSVTPSTGTVSIPTEAQDSQLRRAFKSQPVGCGRVSCKPKPGPFLWKRLKTPQSTS